MTLVRQLAHATRDKDSLPRLYQAALRTVCGFEEWPIGQVFLPPGTAGSGFPAPDPRGDPDAATLVPADVWYAEDPERFSAFRRATLESALEPGRGAAGRVLEKRELVWIEDLAEEGGDPRAEGGSEAPIRGALALPVLGSGALQAILELHDVRPRPPDRDRLVALGDLSFQLGWIHELTERIVRARASRNRTKRIIGAMEAIADSGVDPEDVMRVTAEQIQDLAGATSAGVYLATDDPDVLEMRGASGNAVPFLGTDLAFFSVSQSLSGFAFEEGEVILVNDTANDPRVNRELVERPGPDVSLASFVAVPLIGETSEPVGLLIVMSNRPYAFAEEDVDLLRLLSHQMGIALDRARAFQANEELVRDLADTTSELQTNLRRTEAILDASLHPIVVVDPDSSVVLWSRAAEKLYGWAEDEVVGRPLPVIPEERRERARAILDRVRAGEVMHNVDASHERRDGSSVEVRISMAPIVDEGEEIGLVMVVTDMTELRTVEARLLHAERMESIGRLAAGVAHDFNNMLTAIRGHTDLLLAEPLGPDASESVREIQAAVERSSSVVRQLQVYARRREHEPELVRPSEVISETAGVLDHTIGEQVRLALDLDPEAGPILADPSQLDQLVTNLVLNARDAMPDGGEVGISTAVVDSGAIELKEADLRTSGACVRISVSDTGEGIPPEIRGRIFEPFFSTRGAARGIGLGLATVHGIVSQAGGGIRLETEEGEGTTVHCYFPMADEGATPDGSGPEEQAFVRTAPDGAAPDASTSKKSVRGDEAGGGGEDRTGEDGSGAHRERKDEEPVRAADEVERADSERSPPREAVSGTVLLMEPAGEVRSLISRILEPQGLEIVAEPDREATLERLRAGDPVPDLLITDITRGRVEPESLLEEVRKLKPGLPVLLLSDDRGVERYAEHEAVRAITKPFSPDTLSARVREMLGEGDLRRSSGR